MTIDLFSRIKGQLAQGLAAALLENYAYRVIRIGIEEQYFELKFLPQSAYLDLGLPKQLRTLPDLLVTTPDCRRAWMVEVKMRTRLTGATLQQLGQSLREQAVLWPETYTIIFLGHAFRSERDYIQDHLRVITPDNIDMLVESSTGAERKWEALPMLHHVFELVDAGDFFTLADQIVPAIQALGLSSRNDGATS